MNSIWLIIGAVCAFAVAYRYYSAFLAARVAMLDDRRTTPAHRLRDGVDYHPTKKLVLFGHHFAAIAGPGPLVGPVLAAQWGYLPGFIWIVIGACLAGAVHDFVILWASVRENGLSLPLIARRTIGPVGGITTSVATLFIIVCTLASVAIVVVNALAESPWGMFTILVTIPAALLTGLWMYKIRPGRVGEASAIGVAIVLAGVFLGKPFAESSIGHTLLFEPKTLSLLLPAYALVASILPVWVLMCPRDYLSSYMKIGVMAVLAVGIFAAHPTLKMPATTPFLHNGPVVSGSVWPFVCIVIMCGAISGFHALIASGTTPKMLNKESDIRPIGYGAMVVEGFISVTALIAACALQPGDYFAINMPHNTPAAVARYEQLVNTTQQQHGWDIRPHELMALEQGTGEKLTGRTGGAVTLAVGMAKVFSSVPGMSTLMSYWYHFIIMFEALFILTLLETGTRVARFVFQETADQFKGGGQPAGGGRLARLKGQETSPLRCESCGYILTGLAESRCPECGQAFDPEMAAAAASSGRTPNWMMNVVMSVITCGAWGYLLYTGNLNTLWGMLGIANQLLASIALAVGTTYLLLHAPKRRYALCTGIPFAFVVATVFVAGIQKLKSWWAESAAMAASGAPGQAFMLHLMCALATLMLLLSATIAIDAVRRWIQILSRSSPRPAPEPVASVPD